MFSGYFLNCFYRENEISREKEPGTKVQPGYRGQKCPKENKGNSSI